MTDSCSIVSVQDLRKKYPQMGKLLQKLSPDSPILRDINNRIDSSPDAAKIKAMIKNAEQTPCSQAGGAQQKRGKDTGSGRNWRGNVGQFVTIMIALCVALLSINDMKSANDAQCSAWQITYGMAIMSGYCTEQARVLATTVTFALLKIQLAGLAVWAVLPDGKGPKRDPRGDGEGDGEGGDSAEAATGATGQGSAEGKGGGRRRRRRRKRTRKKRKSRKRRRTRKRRKSRKRRRRTRR